MDNILEGNTCDKKKRGRKPLIQVIEFNIPNEYMQACTIKNNQPRYEIPTRVPEP